MPSQISNKVLHLTLHFKYSAPQAARSHSPVIPYGL